jgi:hypothetical protein
VREIEEREIMKWMVLMCDNQSVCHRSVRQRSGYSGIIALDLVANHARQSVRGGRMVLTRYGRYQYVTGGKGLRQSTWTHYWSQLGFTLPSQARHSCIRQGLQYDFSINIITPWLFCVWGRRTKAEDRFPAIQKDQ